VKRLQASSYSGAGNFTTIRIGFVPELIRRTSSRLID